VYIAAQCKKFAMKLSHLQQTRFASLREGYERKHYVTDMNNCDKKYVALNSFLIL
jgi:hypothetical protein